MFYHYWKTLKFWYMPTSAPCIYFLFYQQKSAIQPSFISSSLFAFCYQQNVSVFHNKYLLCDISTYIHTQYYKAMPHSGIAKLQCLEYENESKKYIAIAYNPHPNHSLKNIWKCLFKKTKRTTQKKKNLLNFDDKHQPIRNRFVHTVICVHLPLICEATTMRVLIHLLFFILLLVPVYPVYTILFYTFTSRPARASRLARSHIFF